MSFAASRTVLENVPGSVSGRFRSGLSYQDWMRNPSGKTPSRRNVLTYSTVKSWKALPPPPRCWPGRSEAAQPLGHVGTTWRGSSRWFLVLPLCQILDTLIQLESCQSAMPETAAPIHRRHHSVAAAGHVRSLCGWGRTDGEEGVFSYVIRLGARFDKDSR